MLNNVAGRKEWTKARAIWGKHVQNNYIIIALWRTASIKTCSTSRERKRIARLISNYQCNTVARTHAAAMQWFTFIFIITVIIRLHGQICVCVCVWHASVIVFRCEPNISAHLTPFKEIELLRDWALGQDDDMPFRWLTVANVSDWNSGSRTIAVFEHGSFAFLMNLPVFSATTDVYVQKITSIKP